MSRQKSGQAVSLFPFLAVLVSAMGALILLLLVTTSKLRTDAVAKAKAEQAQEQAAAALKLAPLPIPEGDPAFSIDASKFVVTVQSPAKQLLPPAPPPVPDRTLEREALRKQWEDKLADMRQNWDRLQKRVKQGQVLLTSQSQQEEGLAVEIADLQSRINQLLLEKGDTSEKVETAKATELTMAQQIAVLQAELDKLKTEKKEQADKFQLVPYAGTSPTRRRPIIIECDAKAVRFASEEISLSPRDISGFKVEYNPVRAGTEALLKYWEEQRLAGTTAASSLQPDPYLLFVIRPGGTISYYVARRMLEALPIDSGYELVPDSQELIWPISSPEAKAQCQAAIDEALGVRNRVASSMPDGRLPITSELQFEGPDGEFMYYEIQKLRKPNQKLVMGAQRVTRRERPRSSGAVYNPPVAPDKSGFVGPQRDELGGMPSEHHAGRDVQAAQRGHSPPEDPRRFAPGRPFPEEPPPRIAKGEMGSNGSSKGLGSRKYESERASSSKGMTNQPGKIDPTEAAVAEHLPPPLPVPVASSIAKERDVVVTIDSDSVLVGKQSIHIEVGKSNHELQSEFSRELAKQAKRWGRPPQGFHWQPSIRFLIRPGGNQYYVWLQSACNEWGLSNTMEYVFE